MTDRKWTVPSSELDELHQAAMTLADRSADEIEIAVFHVGRAICERLEAILEALEPLAWKAEQERRLQALDANRAAQMGSTRSPLDPQVHH